MVWQWTVWLMNSQQRENEKKKTLTNSQISSFMVKAKQGLTYGW